jgi:hypothetical protein
MRTLVYRVAGQRLIPIGDHTGLMAGSKGYLQAKFEFNDDWIGCMKVASFYSNDEEYAEPLDENNSCMIPPESITKSVFEVRVEGRKPNYRIITNIIREKQSGGDI